MSSWKEGKKQAKHLLGVVVSGRKVCARFVGRGARGVLGSYSNRVVFLCLSESPDVKTQGQRPGVH